MTVLFAWPLTVQAQRATPPYLDQSLTFEARAKDLVSQMTLEEKVAQMNDVAPAIPRLGVPEYNWWNEALHGVARSGLATVFPQAIGLAATWNDSLMLRIATVISDEARAKYHDYIRHDSHQRYQGLTFWSPNINLFRDPRWGRGQETYGEDPFLTGTMGVQFIRGLQGNDPKYLKTVSTVKHFAVHSGPEPERHTFDAVVSERDLRESYLPHFEMGIKDGGAYSLMCAYNSIDGKPACASDMLLRDILRDEWKFPGYIVSDCGAIDDIHRRHKYAATPAQAAADGVKTGTDLECSITSANSSRTYTPSLPDAVHQGLISEAQIDTSVYRLVPRAVQARDVRRPIEGAVGEHPDQRSGFADAPHARIARRARVDRAAQERAQHAAAVEEFEDRRGDRTQRRSVANAARQLQRNAVGSDHAAARHSRGVGEGRGARAVRGRIGSGGRFSGAGRRSGEGSLVARRHAGADAEYFKSQQLDGAPLFTRVDPTVDANWKDGAPRADMNPDDFAVRWSGTLRAPATGTYRLGLVGTMKFRLYLDDSLITQSVYPSHDGEFPDARLSQAAPLALQGGRSYRVRVEAQETYGLADLQFVWSAPHDALEAEALDAARQADAVVLVLGLTARLEGEEMPVQIDGFRGGDRTSLDLPAPQQRLMERVAALGKPTVLVLMSGSAVAVNWAQDHVPAIIEAWYPGQASGTAIADVLFGDYNPAGRLPVTFYKSVNDLPPFDDYKMAGRTYRFFNGTPLYPFGFGLSYTTFAYKNIRTSAESMAKDGSVTVSVDVTNTGTRAGDEVVQLYVRHEGSSVERPKQDLRGYSRVSLAPGETKTVTMPVAAKSLAYWNAQRHRVGGGVRTGPVARWRVLGGHTAGEDDARELSR